MFQTPSLNLLLILPVTIIVAWAIILMIVDLFLPEEKKRWIAWLSLVGIVLAFI
jgi:NADH:ubiquinone oxidoreductase subunit 2 (subunit N)